MICRNCGKDIKNGSRLCTYCGTELTQVTITARQQVRRRTTPSIEEQVEYERPRRKRVAKYEENHQSSREKQFYQGEKYKEEKFVSPKRKRVYQDDDYQPYSYQQSRKSNTQDDYQPNYQTSKGKSSNTYVWGTIIVCLFVALIIFWIVNDTSLTPLRCSYYNSGNNGVPYDMDVSIYFNITETHAKKVKVKATVTLSSLRAIYGSEIDDDIESSKDNFKYICKEMDIDTCDVTVKSNELIIEGYTSDSELLKEFDGFDKAELKEKLESNGINCK